MPSRKIVQLYPYAGDPPVTAHISLYPNSPLPGQSNPSTASSSISFTFVLAPGTKPADIIALTNSHMSAWSSKSYLTLSPLTSTNPFSNP